MFLYFSFNSLQRRKRKLRMMMMMMMMMMTITLTCLALIQRKMKKYVLTLETTPFKGVGVRDISWKHTFSFLTYECVHMQWTTCTYHNVGKCQSLGGSIHHSVGRKLSGNMAYSRSLLNFHSSFNKITWSSNIKQNSQKKMSCLQCTCQFLWNIYLIRNHLFYAKLSTHYFITEDMIQLLFSLFVISCLAFHGLEDVLTSVR